MAALPEEILSMVVFSRVVEARSFSAAARKLGLSKSAVSSRVARLEDRLGGKLLHRSTRRLSLTQDGLRLYERCARMVAEADAVTAVAKNLGDVPHGELRLDAPISFAQMYLAPVLTTFLARFPEVSIELSMSDRFVDLAEQGVDVALRVSARLRDSDLVAKKIATDRTLLCAAPGYLERAGVPETPAELVHHNCLHYSELDPSDEWRFRGPGGSYSVPVTGNLEAGNGTLLRQATLAGLGLAVLPSFMVADELRSGSLVRVLDDSFRHVDIGIYALHPYGRKVPAKVRVLIEHLTKAFARAPWQGR